MGVPDLNANPAQSPLGKPLVLRGSDVYREDTVCADHGLSPVEDLSSARFSIRRKSSYSHTSLRRTLSCPRVCAVDVSGKPARHRGLSLGTICQAVSHGPSIAGQTIHPGRCQRTTGLAHLRGVCATVDRTSPQALHRRRLGAGSREYSLCAGFDYDRPLPFARCFHGRRFEAPRPQ